MKRLSKMTEYAVVCNSMLARKPILNNNKVTLVERFN